MVGFLFTPVACVEIVIFRMRKKIIEKCTEVMTSSNLATRATTLSRMTTTTSPKMNYGQTKRQVSVGFLDLCAVLQVVGILALEAIEGVARRECRK